MESGEACTGRPARWISHASSRHLWCEVCTTDALAGGVSVRRAIGSARRVREPSGRVISNL